MPDQIRWLQQVRMADIAQVGSKNASLGEMISQLHQAGIQVPNGFATTVTAYQQFINDNHLGKVIQQTLNSIQVGDSASLQRAGAQIRKQILDAPLPSELIQGIRSAYATLESAAAPNVAVAVRSSATAEDLPDASFAGQQDTLLNVSGIDPLLEAVKRVFASLYNDRAVSYRKHRGYDATEIALSVGIQQMVRSDTGSSGVLFTLDTESGFDAVVFITSAYGLGEAVVQGSVNPDEFYVYKPALAAGRPAILQRRKGSKQIKMVLGPAGGIETVAVSAEDQQQFSLSDPQVLQLAQFAVQIERHYGRPMDIEWGLDGYNGQLFILQARPETVQSQRDREPTAKRYRLADRSEVLVSGRAIGQKIGQGRVRLIRHAAEIDRVGPGDVLVTDMTDPDWEPAMERAAAIITNRGGRTCHAAIIARELGVPAIVGCGNATLVLPAGQQVTVSCAEGDTGYVFKGLLPFEISCLAQQVLAPAPVQLLMNIGNPEHAFSFCQLPNSGVGLARLEFIINRLIGIHPKALLRYPNLPDDISSAIRIRTAGYPSAADFYVSKLSEGISMLAAAFSPKRVIVRFSDFKSNEYANLIGGQLFEVAEANPMLGFRGAARYLSADFQDCFALECRAIQYVRNNMGLTNVAVMIPFVRTLAEIEAVMRLLQRYGLARGQNGLQVIMMCEIPANALLADQFLQYVDGFSIGSNDLTQLTLGLDRDSGGPIAAIFDERNAAVTTLIRLAIQACRRVGKSIGICGQGPSDHPDFAQWLVEEGIDSLSLNPDTIVETWQQLTQATPGKPLMGSGAL